jgi:hypothetical protein
VGHAVELPNPEGSAAEPSGTTGLPPLYRRPVLLDASRHARLSVRQDGSYDFARHVTALPVNAVEFVLAARNYPIVFAVHVENVVPMVVLGVRPEQNLFVGGDGRWLRGAYVPAYARRYPFIFLESPDRSKLGLCVDEASDLLVESDVRPLFRAGAKTQIVDSMLEFCAAYHRDFAFTKTFSAALLEQGLLTENNATLRLVHGEQRALGGFHVVDEAKLANLDDRVFLDWRRRGWLPLIYAHLISIASWSSLVDLAAGEQP